jgi:hypothetical protein
MSRRSRKRGAQRGGGGWLLKSAIIALALLLVLSAVSYGLLKSYLHSDAFRRLLSDEVSQAAKVRGEFGAFRWDGFEVRTSSFEAEGDGLIRHLRADDLNTEVILAGVRRGVWQLRGTSLRRLDVTLNAAMPPGDAAALPPPPPAAKEEQSRWLPSEVEPDGLEIRELSVNAHAKQGPVTAGGLHVNIRKSGAGHAYQAEIRDGVIGLPFAKTPELRHHRSRLRYQDGRIFVSDASLGAWERGRIHATGEWDFASGQFAFEGGARDLTCAEIFNETWAKRLTGDAVVDFTADNLTGETVARGKLEIRNGVLTALPLLDALAAYADTRRFRMLTLHEARTDWRWRKDEWVFTHLVLASEGLVRLEGSLIVRGRELDGNFRLGLIPGTLASIPGAETDVFLPGERGLLWTPLRITGTLDKPQEDLTDRLIAAAGARMFEMIPETGARVFKYTRSMLGESPSDTVLKGLDTLGKGVEIIEDNTGVIRDVTGVLGGLFGGQRKPPTEPAPEPAPVPEQGPPPASPD